MIHRITNRLRYTFYELLYLDNLKSLNGGTGGWVGNGFIVCGGNDNVYSHFELFKKNVAGHFCKM